MKHVKSYDELNESIFGDLGRLDPKRYDNDKKFLKLYKEIIDDFNKYDQDLRKVAIINNKGKSITSSEINVGDRATLTYVFGKFHPVYNNIHTGNSRAGKRKIKISYIPFSITLRKNELEKMFKTSRINLKKVRVKEEKTIDNLEYNPNISKNYGIFEEPTESDRKKMAMYHEIEDEYRVSADVAGKLLKAFVDEYHRQYPSIKGKYMNSMEISDAKAGIKPVLKYIDVINKDGEELILDIREGDDEKEIRDMLKNMTKKEYDAYCEKKKKETYGEKWKKDEELKKAGIEKWKNKFINLFKKYNIETCPYGGGDKSFDNFDLRYYGYEIQVAFYVNKDISENDLDERIKKLSKEDFENYNFKYRLDQDYSTKKTWYVHIVLEEND